LRVAAADKLMAATSAAIRARSNLQKSEL
jgi:hypothetical protein